MLPCFLHDKGSNSNIITDNKNCTTLDEWKLGGIEQPYFVRNNICFNTILKFVFKQYRSHLVL